MVFLNVRNRAKSALASSITSGSTSLIVVTGEGSKFPTSNFHITIEDEILLCSSRTNDTFTVQRAMENTTAAAHDAGKSVELRITAGIISEIHTEYNSHKSASSVHNATDAATASRIVIRDASARAKFAAPASSGDALIRGTRITAGEMLDANSGFLRGKGVGSNPAYEAIVDGDIPSTLSAVARTTVRRNTGADVGSRRRLNFIEGVGNLLTVTDDSGSEEVDITIGSRNLYASDETEVSVVGTTETERKFFRMLYHTSAFAPTTIRVFAEMRVSSASTGTVRIYIAGTLRITLTTTNTSYELQTGTWTVSGLSNAFHDVSVRLLNSSSPTTFLRTLEVYFE